MASKVVMHAPNAVCEGHAVGHNGEADKAIGSTQASAIARTDEEGATLATCTAVRRAVA